MKRPSKPGYLAVVLDEESAAQLRQLTVHPQVHCHHLTIAYKPDQKTWEKFQDLLGKTVTLFVTGIACDDKGQAVYIPSARSEKKYPHVTVSCANGVKPVYSNSLLEAAHNTGTIEPVMIRLSGTVEFVQL